MYWHSQLKCILLVAWWPETLENRYLFWHPLMRSRLSTVHPSFRYHTTISNKSLSTIYFHPKFLILNTQVALQCLKPQPMLGKSQREIRSISEKLLSSVMFFFMSWQNLSYWPLLVQLINLYRSYAKLSALFSHVFLCTSHFLCISSYHYKL